MEDLASRIDGPIQLTTDGLPAYVEAVSDAFGDWMVEHRILKRNYPEAKVGRTAYVERQNLTMRMNNRRYARATNVFSKKLANHAYSMAIYFMVYNFVRPHKSLAGRTPAMAVGVTDYQWTHEDAVRMVDGLQFRFSHVGEHEKRAD